MQEIRQGSEEVANRMLHGLEEVLAGVATAEDARGAFLEITESSEAVDKQLKTFTDEIEQKNRRQAFRKLLLPPRYCLRRRGSLHKWWINSNYSLN